MKSLYIFCEYGVAVSTIEKMVKVGILFDDLAEDSSCLTKMFRENSPKKNLIIKNIVNVKNKDYDLSVYDLIPYGLTKILVQQLFHSQITINQLKYIDDENEFKKTYNIGNNSYRKIMDALDLLMKNNKLDYSFTADRLYKLIVRFFPRPFTAEELLTITKSLHLSETDVSECLNCLLKKTKIKYEEQKYSLVYPTLDEALKQIRLSYAIILTEKIKGRTLESIGQDKGLFRERIRQIIKKTLRLLSYTVEEYKYANLFKTYNFSKDLFCELFAERETIYYFLTLKYSKGNKDPKNLTATDLIDEKQKEILFRKNNIVVCYGEHIPLSKINIFETILKNSNQQILVDDLVDLYNAYVIENGYVDDVGIIKKKDIRSLEGILLRCDKVIMSLKRKYRYYDLTDEDKKNLRALLNAEEGFYSTEFMYKENPLLMKDLNIYDLINKTNFKELGYQVWGNYLLSNEIPAFEPYLKNKILKTDYYQAEQKYWNIGTTYIDYLNSMLHDGNLFRYDRNTYITITKLNSMGISKQMITDLQKKIEKATVENEYLNVYSIAEKSSFDEWKKYNLPVDFYDTVISLISNVKMLRFENNRLFIKTEQAQSKEKFISAFIEKYQKIKTEDMQKIIRKEFNMKIAQTTIKLYINKRKYYYDAKKDCTYIG